MRGIRVLIVVLAAYIPTGIYAQGQLSVSSGGSGVPVKGVTIVCDRTDHEVVKNVVDMLCDDLEGVTGVRPSVVNEFVAAGRESIIVGTLGRSAIIDSLARVGVIAADSIRGGWERFLIKTLPGCVVIAGSDRRGTAYGVTTLSRALGVNPWVWWADVPVCRNPSLTVTADYISAEPTVKYRGIFINDEDWGLLPWASGNFEKELGDIGPLTYEKVCRLLLRLKGNMLAPAMHTCTGAFYSHTDSKVVADAYGIIITTSHCEPMMFNNAALSEWNPECDGEWDYATNGDVIRGKFSSRLDEVADYENIYTVGMRGVHDEAMSRERPIAERVALLERVIADQREMLSRCLGKPAEEIPQIFVPYKETLDLYRNGLRLPDDVTVIWPDDNYGYMKSVSSPAERMRQGGAGVYYHTSYLGTPHDYLWLCTTPPAMMYHELLKSYRAGADRYWLLNVGDIKPAELDTQTFFDMAWDFGAFNYDNITRVQPEWLAGIFGERYESEFQYILDEYYRLAWIRKPEYMGWELEWDSPEFLNPGPTDFSFVGYRDAVKRLDDYARLAGKVDRLMSELPDSLVDPFFEMVGYPVLASEMMTRKYLMAQLNAEKAAIGSHGEANYAARQSVEAHDSIETLNRRYNTLADGKWRGMMTVPPGFCARYQEAPVVTRFAGVPEQEVVLRYNPGEAVAGVTLDLRRAVGVGVRLLDGIGYDGFALQLGEPSEGGVEAMIHLDKVDGDSITLNIFHLPFFPLHEGLGCKIGISVDGGPVTVIEYLPVEWSRDWKFNVLRNSALSTVTLPLDSKKLRHELTLKGIDGGMVVQRVVIGDGSLRPGYVGPDMRIDCPD